MNMSRVSEIERLDIQRAYNDVERVADAQDTRPSWGIYQEAGTDPPDATNAFETTKKPTALWQRWVGQSRRAFDDDESLYESRSNSTRSRSTLNLLDTNRIEIMKNWAVEFVNGVSRFHLSILIKEGSQDRHANDNVEWK